VSENMLHWVTIRRPWGSSTFQTTEEYLCEKCQHEWPDARHVAIRGGKLVWVRVCAKCREE
jgi:hypothetical protein